MKIRLGACLLIVSLPLSACSSGEEPAVLPPIATPTAAATPMPPTPVEPSVPLEAMPETAAAASAFAKYFLTSVGDAFAAADPSRIAALSTPQCGGCSELAGSVQALRDEGKRRQGGDYQAIEAVAPAFEGGDVVVDVTYERTAATILDATGAITASAPPTPRSTAQLRLIREGSGWVVQGYRVIAS